MAGVGGMSTQVYYGLGDGVQLGPASLSDVVGFIDSDSSQRYTARKGDAAAARQCEVFCSTRPYHSCADNYPVLNVISDQVCLD